MANRVMGYVICGYNSVDNLMSEQSSPFRRWTTGSGAGSSYRHHDHRNMYNKQMSEGSSPVSSAGSSSNVARWSLGLEHLLADPAGAAAFAHFLAKEFAAENIHFWWSCEQYRTSDAAARGALAGEIWARHLAVGADEAVNVDAAARRHAALLLCQDPPPADLFTQAQKQIFNVMKFDSYPRFLRSGTHAECARADLRGLPPPYAHSRNPPDKQDTPAKNLKKSVSNASERRRSGGASILARLRPASRERQQQSVTDVVKSSQPASLCRVMLPDGATSVVNVDGAVSVAQLVDRLLQRRNLTCNTYDVMWKEPKEGESSIIDQQSPSSILGGREALVERRAVLRLELVSTGAGAGTCTSTGAGTCTSTGACTPPRCVLVRCGGGRPLLHVLRRVAARYRLHHVTALRDNVPLHHGTLMQDLDGCRLQVIEVNENGEQRAGPHCERDSDADSLSDLALRLQDERDLDSQSNSTGSSRSNSGHGAWGGARVRAALRPGAPLHHHPPDFLDNLRETQRVRLAKDPPPTPAAPPAPAPPRTPPPLPPKPAPAHRGHPTLV